MRGKGNESKMRERGKRGESEGEKVKVREGERRRG